MDWMTILQVSGAVATIVGVFGTPAYLGLRKHFTKTADEIKKHRETYDKKSEESDKRVEKIETRIEQLNVRIDDHYKILIDLIKDLKSA